MSAPLELLRRYTQALRDAGAPEPAADVRYALSHYMGCSVAGLLMELEAGPEAEAAMDAFVARRACGEPTAYILGEQYFMGMRFLVNQHVLIPRQDTEILAEKAEALLSQGMAALDLCTGSGCIAVALGKRTGAQITGADISAEALRIAREQAARHGVEVEFVRSDLFAAIAGKYDVITANPPYVTEAEYAGLMREVRCYEPRLALVAGEDGLAFYRHIVPESRLYLRPGGWLAMEIGCTRAAAVRAMMEEHGFSQIEVLQDYAGLDRVILGACE